MLRGPVAAFGPGPAGQGVRPRHDAVAAARVDVGQAQLDVPPLAACGMWTDLSIRLLTLPTLQQVLTEPLGGVVIPRSLAFAPFGESIHLLCALGDGQLITYRLRDGSAPAAAEMSDGAEAGGSGGFALAERKVVSLGTQPVSLTRFVSKGTPHVFACSDRPAVVHSANQKLLYSNVNVKEVTHMAPFDSEAFPECLAIASDDALLIGTIDDIQKLHIRTVPLGEQPRRLCHVESVRVFSLLTVSVKRPYCSGSKVDGRMA